MRLIIFYWRNISCYAGLYFLRVSLYFFRCSNRFFFEKFYPLTLSTILTILNGFWFDWCFPYWLIWNSFFTILKLFFSCRFHLLTSCRSVSCIDLFLTKILHLLYYIEQFSSLRVPISMGLAILMFLTPFSHKYSKAAFSCSFVQLTYIYINYIFFLSGPPNNDVLQGNPISTLPPFAECFSKSSESHSDSFFL